MQTSGRNLRLLMSSFWLYGFLFICVGLVNKNLAFANGAQKGWVICKKMETLKEKHQNFLVLTKEQLELCSRLRTEVSQIINNKIVADAKIQQNAVTSINSMSVGAEANQEDAIRKAYKAFSKQEQAELKLQMINNEAITNYSAQLVKLEKIRTNLEREFIETQKRFAHHLELTEAELKEMQQSNPDDKRYAEYMMNSINAIRAYRASLSKADMYNAASIPKTANQNYLKDSPEANSYAEKLTDLSYAVSEQTEVQRDGNEYQRDLAAEAEQSRMKAAAAEERARALETSLTSLKDGGESETDYKAILANTKTGLDITKSASGLVASSGSDSGNAAASGKKVDGASSNFLLNKSPGAGLPELLKEGKAGPPSNAEVNAKNSSSKISASSTKAGTSASSLSKDLKKNVEDRLAAAKASATSTNSALGAGILPADIGGDGSAKDKTDTADKEVLASISGGGGLGDGFSPLGLAGPETDSSIKEMVNDMLGNIFGNEAENGTAGSRELASMEVTIDAEGRVAAQNNKDIGGQESTPLYSRVRAAINRQFSKGNIVYGLRNKI